MKIKTNKRFRYEFRTLYKRSTHYVYFEANPITAWDWVKCAAITMYYWKRPSIYRSLNPFFTDETRIFERQIEALEHDIMVSTRNKNKYDYVRRDYLELREHVER